MHKTPQEVFDEKMDEIDEKYYVGWKKGLLNLLSISIASFIIAFGKEYFMPSQVPSEVSNRDAYIHLETLANTIIIFIPLTAIYVFYTLKKIRQYKIKSAEALEEMQKQMMVNLKNKQQVKTKQPQKTK